MQRPLPLDPLPALARLQVTVKVQETANHEAKIKRPIKMAAGPLKGLERGQSVDW